MTGANAVSAITIEPHSITLDVDQVRAIRNALLVGFDSFAEIERAREEFERVIAHDERLNDCVPRVCCTDSSFLGDFAYAMRSLER